MRTTHSLATLPISKEAYEEIKQKMLAAGYNGLIHGGITGEMISLPGFAFVVEKDYLEPDHCVICDKFCSPNNEGQLICYDCSCKTLGDVMDSDPELSKKDKNYLINETKVEF